MDLQLAGKRALITGGSKGIGRATAEVLADEGCDLVLVARDAAALEDAAARVRARRQVNVRTIAADLSHGQKQWLEIGMATALKPRFLLLDEPTAGMSPEETHATGEMVRSLNAGGVTVLAVEHDMDFVMGLTDRLVVMEFGTKLAEGSAPEIRANPSVVEAYLGSVA